MKRKTFYVGLIILLLTLCPPRYITQSVYAEEEEQASQEKISREIINLDLETCIDLALENNNNRKVSQFALQIAEAQYKQALSAFYPQLSLRSVFTQLDEDPNFLFPSQTYTYEVAGPFPIPISATAEVPEIDVKLMDKRTLASSLVLSYPLYTGGKIRSIAKQAEMGLEAAREETRRTDLQVIYDVKRMFYGYILARKLYEIGKENLERMEVTLDLTEELYTKSSGTVKKTDYLRNKVVVESIRSIVAFLESNVKIARAALINTMGLNWDTEIEIDQNTIPYTPYSVDLHELVLNAYSFNPDWAKIEAGLKAAEQKIRESKSGYFPVIGFEGSLNRLDNNYDSGLMTDENKNSWSVGVGLELPLFRGFRTRNKVKEARAHLDKIEHEKILLREGIALQIKHIFYTMLMAQQQQSASAEAAKAAEENRELNIRAYRDELVETQDVIEAQLLEFVVDSQYQKALYDHVHSQIHLDFVVGEEIKRILNLE